MKFPKFLRFWKEPEEFLEIPEEEKETFFDWTEAAQMSERANQLYEGDPNALNPKEVAKLLSKVLRGLAGAKTVLSS